MKLKSLSLILALTLMTFACSSETSESTNESSETETETETETSDSVTASSVQIDDITFYFDSDYSVGQYVDGQWWVHNDGDNVVVTAITPSAYEEDGRVFNGAELNPENSSSQGFQSTDDANAYFDMSYDADKNVAPGATGSSLSIAAGNSLVKAITREPSSSERTLIEQAAVLTVVAENQPDDAFRPAYAGTDKSLSVALSDLNYDVLGQFEPLVDTPHISTFEDDISGLWLDHNTQWTQRNIHPLNSMPTYGREIARYTSEVGLQLQLNYSNEEKEPALISLVQYAIDLYGVLQIEPIDNNENYYWYNNGGHNQGRKLPLLIAGLVLNNSGMLSAVNSSQGEPLFQEDQQTFYVSQSDIDYSQTDAFEGASGFQQADLGLAEWSTRAWDQHNATLDSDWGRSYRNVNGCNSVTTALAVRMMAAVDYWAWPAFFDYTDRYFSIEGDDTSEALAGNLIRTVPAALWNEYRESLGDIYTEDLAE